MNNGESPKLINDENKQFAFTFDQKLHTLHPVSYTHLDVYKRQP